MNKMNDKLDQISNDNESIDSDRFRSINQIFKETATEQVDMNKKRQSRSLAHNNTTGASSTVMDQKVVSIQKTKF